MTKSWVRYFLYLCMCVLVAQSYLTLRPHGLQPARLLCPWDSPGKNTEVGSHFLLQGIFPTQRSNSGLMHCRQILYQLSHKGSPKTLEWVAYPFSSESSPSRNWARVSCIVGGFFFTNWTIGKPTFFFFFFILSSAYLLREGRAGRSSLPVRTTVPQEH